MVKESQILGMPPLTKEAEYYVLKRLQESPDRKWTLKRGGRDLLAVVITVLHLLLLTVAFVMFTLTVFSLLYVEAKVDLFDGLDINKSMAFLICLCVSLIVVHGLATGFFYKFKRCTEFNKNWFRGVKVYLTAVSILLLLVIAGTFVCFMLSNAIGDQLHHSIFAAMKQYKYNPKLKTRIDTMQQSFRCCGGLSARDWSSVSWIGNHILDMESREVKRKIEKNEYFPSGVPYSCCSIMAKAPCVHVWGKHHDRVHDMNIYKHGCSDKLLEYFEVIFLLPVGILLIVTATIKIAILLFTRILQTSVTSAHLLGDDNGVGYAHLMPEFLQNIWYEDS